MLQFSEDFGNGRIGVQCDGEMPSLDAHRQQYLRQRERKIKIFTATEEYQVALRDPALNNSGNKDSSI